MSSKFLRLSCGLILNPRYIDNIQINPTYISISILNFEIRGWHLLSIGYINSSNSYSYIYEKEKDAIDYNNIMKWVNKNSETGDETNIE
uniref:Uncharacterized protein n=1 Tax=viral metagenome TaxID=1070528 RepID=A0A6C0IRH8_9ZZZZ